MVNKVAFLIPTTSRNTKFKKLEDTYLYKYLIPTLMRTLSNDHQYTIYYAIDDDDKLYHKLQTKRKLLNIKLIKPINKVKIISTKGIEKGNVVGMWNRLFKIAYNDKNDYFVQSGDDIIYYDKNWLEICIKSLSINHNLGVASPVDIKNPYLMTQSVVHRRHYEIFEYYYPHELTSWFCDNWITDLYKRYFAYIIQQRLENRGGKPRYTPPEWDLTKKLCKELVDRDKIKLRDYMNKEIS